MFKRAAGFATIVLVLCFAACSGTQPLSTATPRPSDIEAACEQVVLNFTDGEPVEFAHVSFEDYVYQDDRYEYVVDSQYLYIKKISTISYEEHKALHTEGTKAGTKEAAENLGVEIYKKVMSGLLLDEGGIKIKCLSPEETLFFVEINETINGIPTGTFASIDMSASGNILNAIFVLGDAENTDRLINEQDKMISVEDAKKIALEKIDSMAAELEAENIQIDESEPCEIVTLGDTTVWAVPFTYTKQGVSYICGGIVNVEVFSGEVIDVRMYA